MSLRRELFWLITWGIAFAYIEASIVVYLRQIYYPEGFAFPVVMTETKIAITEIIRELATLIIIWATAELASRKPQGKASAFMILFGIWDIFYYLFLKVSLDWPESPATWDILFLIPLPWAGPVWAPVVVSLGLIYAGVALLMRIEQGGSFRSDGKFIVTELIAGGVIIASFIIPGYCVITQSIPEHFPWYLFWAGFLSGFGSFLYRFYRITP